MRTTLAASLSLALVAAPLCARAQSVGCLIGPSDAYPCSVGGGPAALLGAIAAPVIVAGAAVTVANQLGHRVEERDDLVPPATGKRPNLALVPDPPDPYREPPNKKKREGRTKPSPAFQFNETATNVATAVTGAMVVGAVIATIVTEAKK